MKRFIFLGLSLSLSACFTDGGGGSDPALEGTWEDTLFASQPEENRTYMQYSFGADGAFAMNWIDFDKDSAGLWVDAGGVATTGEDNSYAPVPGDDAYVLLDYAIKVGEQPIAVQEVRKWAVAGGKLDLTSAYAYTGSSNAIQGYWKSILDSSQIDLRINKLLYSFTITPDGKFISHFPDDTLDVDISPTSLTIQDVDFLGPVVVDYRISNGKLFMYMPDTKITLKKKGA